MANTHNSLKAGSNFPAEVVKEIFSKVQGHSALANLSNQTPVPFNGTEQFIFNLEGNAQIVGEGGEKKPGKASLSSKVIKPLKFVYQARITDEFKYAAQEEQINYLSAFSDGFAKKIAEAFDIAAIHGLEPQSMTDASFKATNSFDGLVTGNVIEFNANNIESDIETAVQTVISDGGDVNGLALSHQAASALGKVAINGVPQYQEFRFGGRPTSFHGMKVDVNRTLVTVADGQPKDHAIVGDFEGSFKWGYALNIPMEIIEYGDPDNTGRDLKAYNEILLRAEAYIGWGILLPENFARIEETAGGEEV